MENLVLLFLNGIYETWNTEFYLTIDVILVFF
jgi:hypothetical protein